MKTKLFFALAALALVLAPSSQAGGLIIIHNPPDVILFPPDRPRPPVTRPAPRPHPVFAPMEVVYHKVDVSISGQQATTRVNQEFYNPNNATLEGEFLFPVPEGAHIDRFSMRIGDQDMPAELLDAAKARAIYEEIVRKQRDPALLEYTGRPAFRVRIFPIEPHSRKRVQIAYTQLLKNDAGVIAYTYPLNTEKYSAQPIKTVALKITLEQPAPLKTIYSPSHEIETRRDGERRAVVGWETANARPDRDFQLLFSTAESDVGMSLVTQRLGDEGTFLLLVSPGAAALKPGEKPNAKDVVFVLDTSGSMSGKKIAQAKKALDFCVASLNPADRFEVLRFSTEAEPLFSKLADATPENQQQAKKWVDGFQATGGTAINDALQAALKLRPASADRPFIVVFLTDGQPTVGESNEDRIVAGVASAAGGAPTRIFCFGLGTDVNTHLLDKITEKTRAASTFVLPDEDIEIKVSSFFTKVKEPMLTNLKFTWPDGVRVSKDYPNPPPDLFRGEQLVLTGRYKGTGAGELVIEGMLNGETRRIAQRVTFPESESGNEFVPQLWALRRVGWLLDEMRLRGDNPELRDEVAELARRYGIITPYTSYLIVEDEQRRNVPVAARTQRALERDRVAFEVIGGSLADQNSYKAGEAGANLALSNQGMKSAQNYGGARGGFGGGGAGGASAPAAPSSTPSLAQANVANANGIVSGASNLAVSGNMSRADVARRIEAAQQNSATVRNKTFYQNGNQWQDSEIQRQQTKNTQRIAFASDEYFALLRANRDAAEWLALGNNVQFVLGDTLYDIYETPVAATP